MQYRDCLRIVIIGLHIMVKGRYIFFIVDLKLRLWKTKCDFNNEYSITYQLIFITQLCNLQNRLIK